MKTKWTKRLRNQLVSAILQDDDFDEPLFKHYGKWEESAKRFYANIAVLEYLFGDYEYLDKQYQDKSWFMTKQYGKTIICDMDTLYDLFVSAIKNK